MGWYQDAVSNLERLKVANEMQAAADKAAEAQRQEERLDQERAATAQEFYRMAPAFGIEISAARAQEMADELVKGDTDNG